MRILTAPFLRIEPVGPIATATQVEIFRGPESTIRPVSDILPSSSSSAMNQQQLKREVIIRAWVNGTAGPAGGNPVLIHAPNFRALVNAGQPGAGIFSRAGRVFLGDIKDDGAGMLRVPFGLSASTPSEEILVSPDEIAYPSAESPLDSAIPFIAAQLASRDANRVCEPGVRVADATRLYPVIQRLVEGYEFYYFGD